ncbi:hypothetical protein C8R44DRAFT_987711 [Mycena epipterygia]|nr:hypothetical protein C8R44DRAFT_987711 [Mycena epipterygia]
MRFGRVRRGIEIGTGCAKTGEYSWSVRNVTEVTNQSHHHNIPAHKPTLASSTFVITPLFDSYSTALPSYRPLPYAPPTPRLTLALLLPHVPYVISRLTPIKREPEPAQSSQSRRNTHIRFRALRCDSYCLTVISLLTCILRWRNAFNPALPRASLRLVSRRIGSSKRSPCNAGLRFTSPRPSRGLRSLPTQRPPHPGPGSSSARLVLQPQHARPSAVSAPLRTEQNDASNPYSQEHQVHDASPVEEHRSRVVDTTRTSSPFALNLSSSFGKLIPTHTSLPGRGTTEAQDPPARDRRTRRPRIAGAYSSRRPKTARRNPSAPEVYSARIRPWSNRSALVDGRIAQCRDLMPELHPPSRVSSSRGVLARPRGWGGDSVSAVPPCSILLVPPAARLVVLHLVLGPRTQHRIAPAVPREIGRPNFISANAKHRYFSTSRTRALATARDISIRIPFDSKIICVASARMHALLAIATLPYASQRRVAKPVSSVYDRANTKSARVIGRPASPESTDSRSKRRSPQSPLPGVA